MILIYSKNTKYENIISWSQDGVAFVIKNVQELAEKVIIKDFFE